MKKITTWKHPTVEQLALEHGDHVHHETHGAGVILNEWGTWPACSNCYKELDGKPKASQCCDAPVLSIPGNGTMVVKFKRAVEYINCIWLQPIAIH